MEESIQNTVNKLRTERGITQEELAEKLAVSRQTVIAIERGNYTPSVLLAIKIAKVFNERVKNILHQTCLTQCPWR